MKSAPREVLVERFGNLKLPLGSTYEYIGVRGKQGRQRDKFQGYTPKKTHFTRLVPSAQEAAVALATLKLELMSGYDPAQERRPRKKRGRLIEDEPTTLKWQATESISSTRPVAAEHAPTPIPMSENYMYMYSPPINRRLPLAVAGPVIQASALQQLTPQQALEAAACGKAVVHAICTRAVTAA